MSIGLAGGPNATASMTPIPSCHCSAARALRRTRLATRQYGRTVLEHDRFSAPGIETTYEFG